MDFVSFIREKQYLDDSVLSQLEDLLLTAGGTTEEALLQLGFDVSTIRNWLSEYYELPSYTFTEDTTISAETLSYISEDSARHYQLIPLFVQDGILHVATPSPDNVQLREVLNFISLKNGISYKLHYILSSDLDKGLVFYGNLKGDVTEVLGVLDAEVQKTVNFDEQTSALEEPSAENLEHIKEDAPITKIVASILRYAIEGGASDIHVEPNDKKVIVRYRVDGVLQTSLELPKNTQMAVAARIKILASLRLDERRKPQDGRFSATLEGRKIDFRVSVLPTNYGEKVVMRILDNEKGVRTLEDVGIGGHHLETIRRILQEPYGIILISGPTGSGKSTTLYAMLAEVDKLSKNVLSLEDPVEYNIEGVSQSQMRPEIGYTFAHGLRAALRQDPDIIMVGEIRDKETAQLAIQAALTGHLVLSTIHTNNSIGVIPRLIDMGVDPYLIAPTLKLAIAQRLARRVKSGTGKVEPVSDSLKLMFEDSFRDLPSAYRGRIPVFDSVVHPEPSPGCTTGMKGRIAIMETLEMNDAMQALILKNSSEEEMYTEARKQGFITMQEDAIIKALKHEIPVEEMNNFGTKIGLSIVPEEEIDLPVNNRANQSEITL
jgi:type IV pilus assembly protein PilB